MFDEGERDVRVEYEKDRVAWNLPKPHRAPGSLIPIDERQLPDMEPDRDDAKRTSFESAA